MGIVRQLYNKNQFVITTSKGVIFQSYNSVVASVIYDSKKHQNIITLFPNWDYSITTRKHLYIFLDEYAYRSTYEILQSRDKRQAIIRAVRDGKIKLKDKAHSN